MCLFKLVLVRLFSKSVSLMRSVLSHFTVVVGIIIVTVDATISWSYSSPHFILVYNYIWNEWYLLFVQQPGGSRKPPSRCDCVVMRPNTSKLVLVFKVVLLTGHLLISVMQPFRRMFLEFLFCNCPQKYFEPQGEAGLITVVKTNVWPKYWVWSLIYILGLGGTWLWITNSFLKMKSPFKGFWFATSSIV